MPGAGIAGLQLMSAQDSTNLMMLMLRLASCQDWHGVCVVGSSCPILIAEEGLTRCFFAQHFLHHGQVALWLPARGVGVPSVFLQRGQNRLCPGAPRPKLPSACSHLSYSLKPASADCKAHACMHLMQSHSRLSR